MPKYLPFTIAKSYKFKYVDHYVADFETCYTPDHSDVRVWAWGLLDYINGEYIDGTNIDSFLDKILSDKKVYDIGFHNLKFDGTFIVPQLFRRGYRYMTNSEFMEAWKNEEDLTKVFTHTISSMGQWFSLTIVKDKKATKTIPAFVHVWDTYKLFPTRLKDLAVQYNTNSRKVEVDQEFYEQIREEGHQLTELERFYLQEDCAVIGQALVKQLEKYDTVFRTQASKAFTFFKEECNEGKCFNYKLKYEGKQRWIVPKIAGLEHYEGAIMDNLPKAIRDEINERHVKLIDAKEYYVPDFFTWADIKRAYTGGIAYVNPRVQELNVDGDVTVIDVNSMYPYCLRTFPIPYGRMVKGEGEPIARKRGVWVAGARVSFKLKSEHNLPCIQIKQKYGRKWLTESTDYMQQGRINKYNDDVIFFTSVDYETYCENYDFTVHQWLYHYYIPNAANVDGKRFIDKYYAEKQKADNVMTKIKREKPESYQDDPDFIKASLDRQEAKIAMNSAYGKHGTKYFLYSKDSVYEGPDQPVRYKAESELSRDPHKEPSHFYIPYAAFVTSYARQMLVRMWNAFGERSLYCDTDSLHFRGTEIPDEVKDLIDWEKSGKLGLWKIEGHFTRARYLRAKSYIEVDDEGVEHITCAGATDEIKKLMTWENFRVGFNAWEICAKLARDQYEYERLIKRHSKLTPKHYPSGVALEPVNFEIKPNL